MSLHAYTPHKAIKHPQGKNQLQNIAPRGLASCPVIPLNHCSPLANHQQLPFVQGFFSKQLEFLYITMHSTSTYWSRLLFPLYIQVPAVVFKVTLSKSPSIKEFCFSCYQAHWRSHKCYWLNNGSKFSCKNNLLEIPIIFYSRFYRFIKTRKPSSHIPLKLCNSNNNLKGWFDGICSDLYQQLSWKEISKSKWCPAWRYRCSYRAGTCSLSQETINWRSVPIHIFHHYIYLDKNLQLEHSHACRVVTSVSTGTWCYPLEYFQPASGCPSKGKVWRFKSWKIACSSLSLPRLPTRSHC